MVNAGRERYVRARVTREWEETRIRGNRVRVLQLSSFDLCLDKREAIVVVDMILHKLRTNLKIIQNSDIINA